MVRSSPVYVVALAGMGASFQTNIIPTRGIVSPKSNAENHFSQWTLDNVARTNRAIKYGRQSLMSSTTALQTDSDDKSVQSKFLSLNSQPTDDDVVHIESSMETKLQALNSDTGISEITPDVSSSKETKMAALVLLAGIASFASLVLFSGPGSWRYFLAGGICAATSHSVTTPIDVVKTRQQVDPQLQGKGIVKSTMKIIKKDGVGSLLAGLGPTTVGYLIEGAVKFGVYEILKPVIGFFLGTLSTILPLPFINSRFSTFFLSGISAGTIASIALCPMESLRIRMVAEPEYAKAGLVKGSLKMTKEHGIKGLWKGLTPMLCKQVPYTVTKNVSFDFLTTLSYSALRVWGVTICARYKLLIPLVSAMLASVLSTISSQPGDMLLSVISAHDIPGKRTRDFSREIIKERGIKGFFVGINARFLHVGVIVTLQLLMYDYIKRLCGLAATGH